MIFMKASVTLSEKDNVIYKLTHCTHSELGNKIDSFFLSEGYKAHSIHRETKTYTKGEKIMRLFFGGFADYFEQDIVIKKEGGDFYVSLPKNPAGLTVGFLGNKKIKKEFFRLNESLKAHLQVGL